MWQLKKKGPTSDRVGGPAARSTKLDCLSSIGSLHQNFGDTIFLGTLCAVSAIITRQLISWYSDGSQNNNVLRWSNVTRFLTGHWTRDEVDWGNLPLEIWGEIGKRMVSQLDNAYFRCVCKRWRLSLPSPTRFPLRLPLPPGCDPKFHDMPYTISEVTIYGDMRKFGAYPHPYMQVNQGGIFPLMGFVASAGDELDFHESSLLGRSHLASLGVMLSQLNFFAKAYFSCMDLGPHKRRHKRRNIGFPDKLVVISSSNAYGVNPGYARASDLSVVAYFCGEGRMKGRLALLRLGGPREDWVWDTDFCTQVFANIATYKGQLCTLDSHGRVFLMDYNTLQMTQVCEPLYKPSPEHLERKSLFEAYGDLYLFDLMKPKRGLVSLNAYKLNFRLQKWLKVEEKVSCCELFVDAACFNLCEHKKTISFNPV